MVFKVAYFIHLNQPEMTSIILSKLIDGTFEHSVRKLNLTSPHYIVMIIAEWQLLLFTFCPKYLPTKFYLYAKLTIGLGSSLFVFKVMLEQGVGCITEQK